MSSGDDYPLTNRTMTLSNGRYSTDVTCYCADGKACISDDTNEDYPYYITDLTAETAGASLTTSEGTTTIYSGITAAVAAASSGDTVTLLRNVGDSGIAVETDESKENGKTKLTIDLNGYTYTIVTTVGSSGTETNGMQLKTGGSLTIKNGTIKAGKSTVKLLIQNYCNLTLEDVTLDGTYSKKIEVVLSCNNGDTVLTENTNILTYNSSQTAIDVFYWPSNGYGEVSVTLDSNFTGTVDGDITYGSDGSEAGKAGVADYATLTIEAGTITGTITTSDLNTDKDSTIIISGGTFENDDVSAYVVTNYYQDSTGEVVKSLTQVSEYDYYTNDEDGSTIKVTLTDLADNLEVNNAETATIEVVVTDAPAKDVSALNTYFSEQTITPTDDGFAVDISVVKTTSEGETTISEISGQSVTVTLPLLVADGTTTTVYHVTSGGTVETIGSTSTSGVTVEGNTVTFTTSSFSTYYIDYTAAELSALQITDTVTLNLTEVTANVPGEYYITLDAEDGEYINRFMAAELALSLDQSCGITEIGAVTITPASYIDIIDNGDGEYEFNVNGDANGNGETISDISGASILLGTLTITGDGTFKLTLKTTLTTNTDNQVQTAETSNNIVSTYNVGGSAGGELLYNTAALASGKLTLAQSKLIINVMFPNAVTARNAEYNDMKVTVTGIGVDEEIEIGQDVQTSGLQTVTISGVDSSNDYTTATGYVATIDDVYTGYSYTLEFTGAGYRTYRMTVVPDGDSATVTVWNNAMSNDMVVVSSDENAMGAVTDDVTFLAGDIVANNLIDLWDLSAVVSYFGKAATTEELKAAWDYTMYDLNRDGKIDSRDIAMVLVSWNK